MTEQPSRAAPGTTEATESLLTRRRALAAASTTLAGSLAGCSLGSSSEDIGLTHGTMESSSSVSFNPENPNYTDVLEMVVFDPLCVESADGTLQTVAATDFDVSNEGSTPPELTVSLPADWSWWDGHAVEATDLELQLEIARELNAGGSPRYDSIDVLDSETVRVQRSNPLAARFARSDFLGNTVLNMPRWVYAPHLESLRDATTTQAHETAATALAREELDPERLETDQLGNGVYRLETVNSKQFSFERFESHPRASSVSVASLAFNLASEETFERKIAAGNFDFGGRLLPAHLRNTSKTPIEVLEVSPADGGKKLVCNYENPHLARRNVRRALLAALDLERICENSPGFGYPARAQTGMSPPREGALLEESLSERLHSYPVSADIGRAHRYLERAGYRPDGATWNGPDGKPLSLSLLSPTFPDFSIVADTIETDLDAAGFDVETQKVQRYQWFDQLELSSYDVALFYGGGGPRRAYDPTDHWKGTLGLAPPGDESEANDQPSRLEIPRTPGALGVEGDGRELDLVELWNEELSTATTSSEFRDAVALFARYWNYELPDIQLAADEAMVWGNPSEFDWPDEGDPAYRSGVHAGVTLAIRGMVSLA